MDQFWLRLEAPLEASRMSRNAPLEAPLEGSCMSRKAPLEAPLEASLESAIVVAGSIANHAINGGYNVGLYVNEPYKGTREPIRLAPSRHPGHLQRILVALAHPQGWPLQSIERVLMKEGRNIPWGASIVVITSTPTDALLGSIRRFKKAGRSLSLIQVGNSTGTTLPRDIQAHFVSDQVHQPVIESRELTL